MIVLYTTERDYPWGTLRSTHASKTKVVLEEKRIPYRIENLPPIWMPYWSDPEKRDKARMEKGREGLRTRDLPYIEQLLGAVAAMDFICGDFSIADVGLMMVAMVLEVDQMALDGLPRVKAYL